MKRILLIVFLFSGLSALAQPFNNEWIDYSKTYYKFKVATNGLHRISQSALANIGMSNANADHFQLWRNGEEVPLYTTSTGGPLASGGYIEFWGLANDGKPDNALYRNPDWQLNDKYSLQTDTAAYFLTINPTGNNRRLTPTDNNISTNTLPAETWFTHTLFSHYKVRMNPGRAELVGSSYTYSSSYDMGEGYASAEIVGGGSSVVNFSNIRPYLSASAPAASLFVAAAGNAVYPRNFRVMVNNDSITGGPLDYYDYAKRTGVVPNTLLSTGNALINFANQGAVSNARMVVAMVSLTYPRTYNFNNTTSFEFELPASSGQYLEITNFNTGGIPPVLYDLTNGQRYVAQSATQPYRYRLTESSVKRHLVMVNQAATNFKAVETFTERVFTDYLAANKQGDFIMIASYHLYNEQQPAGAVEEYRQYRSSAAGGSYNAKVYMYDQLEDQFAFGIKFHPLSIRNFVHWARANYSTPLKSVLLFGKAVIYNQIRASEAQPDLYKLSMVPTFGNPASDNLLTSLQHSSIPMVPIGRISAINNEEVASYLEKVKEYESLYDYTSPIVSDKAWKKNVVHVVGAGDNNTSNLLASALRGHQRILEDTMYGANVHTFAKTSADAVEQVASVRLGRLFEDGIGVLTYFGHSSSNALEFNLDNPQAYNNAGKYPIMIVMGCNAGSFYNYNQARLTTTETISEKFVLAKNRGSVAFLASTHLGIIHYLDIYNTRFYRAMTNTHYGGTIGEIMDEAIRQTFNLTTENDFYARFQCEQFTLHGDPAIRFYNFDKPDYAIEDAMVSVDPKFIPISETDFKLTAAFVNLGRSINKPIVVELKRTYPNNVTEIIQRDTLSFRSYRDSIVYTLPVVATRDQGLNRITVSVDADNTVDELYETNNVITKDIYIIEDDIRPVHPYRFSIVNKQDIKLTASTANPFANARDYLMEMDTTASFNSPLKIQRTQQAKGGIVEYAPGITLKDSTVYYWRVAPSTTVGEPMWNQSSFQYIENGDEGFSQAHFNQHLSSDANHIRLTENREWKFDSITNNLFVKNGVWGYAIQEAGELVVNVNDSSYIRNTCYYGFVFNVFDEKTFKPWVNQAVGSTGMYNSTIPCARPSAVWNFEYPNTAVGRNNAMQFLRNIPDGKFVVLRTQVYAAVGSNQYAVDWKADEDIYGVGNSLYAELKNNGLTDIDSVNKPRVLNFVYQKNRAAVHPPKFVISHGLYDAINLSFDCVTPRAIASIESPVIGPANAWSQLHWRGSDQSNPPHDEPHVNIIGIRADGSEEQLISGISLAEQDYDLSGIDAVEYPQLRLAMNNIDSVDYSAYQLRYWMVTYNPVPEGAIAPNLYFTTRDTVEVGEPFNFGIGFKNISAHKFDSIKVQMTITGANNVVQDITIPLQKDLASNDTIKLDVPIDTRNLAGKNTIFINFNPNMHQKEGYLFNNYAFRNLYVRPDSLQPMLDVTFDGVHILNRDIVAARPMIIAELKDEAKFLLLNDTSLLNVQVRYPDGHLRRFNFDNDTLRFEPATSASNNAARIHFNPHFLLDGEYELLVSGRDRSENNAGFAQYRVSFQVINKPMISNMLNYPNPFTTSTAFVFTITGSEIPQNIRIQILTITGKVVREITKEELGPLHIGRNITEFKWDGTDQYGQKLANGIYLYRVITNLNGKSLDKYKAQGDNTDKYFNKGYGKMYLMR